jgi:hypothetical protein
VKVFATHEPNLNANRRTSGRRMDRFGNRPGPRRLKPQSRRGHHYAYLSSFQISAASFQSLPIFSHTTTYLPVTSCGVGPFVLRLKVPISRAAEGPSGEVTGPMLSWSKDG